MTELALAGCMFKDAGPDELLGFVAEIGATGLDYWPWNRGEMSPEEFRQAADDAGIAILCVNVPGDELRAVADDPSKALDLALAAMDEAASLGASAIQLYPPTPKSRSHGDAGEALAAELEPLLDAAELRGLRVRLENNFDHRHEDPGGVDPTRAPDTLRRVLGVADRRALRLCFDPANFVVAGVSPFPNALEMLIPYVDNVHLKDCRPYVPGTDSRLRIAELLLDDGGRGLFVPTPLGDGSVPWLDIFGALNVRGYTGWMTLDPFIAPALVRSWCADAAAYWRRVC